MCGSSYAMPNAHYIARAQGGLGIEENIVTLCLIAIISMTIAPIASSSARKSETTLWNDTPNGTKKN